MSNWTQDLPTTEMARMHLLTLCDINGKSRAQSAEPWEEALLFWLLRPARNQCGNPADPSWMSGILQLNHTPRTSPKPRPARRDSIPGFVRTVKPSLTATPIRLRLIDDDLIPEVAVVAGPELSIGEGR